MSRGLGKTQRGILAILADRQWHWVDEIADVIYAEKWDSFAQTTHSLGQEINQVYSFD